jgi:hypothetical protein
LLGEPTSGANESSRHASVGMGRVSWATGMVIRPLPLF